MWAILTFIVAITRLILKRHTPAEVISGGLLGFITGLALIIWK
ncbi:phosphatase PAP2 family protein [Enterobacter kobei]